MGELSWLAGGLRDESDIGTTLLVVRCPVATGGSRRWRRYGG